MLQPAPRSGEQSADLMHWFMHRFPPLRQFTFAHGGNRDLLKLTIAIAVSFLHQTGGGGARGVSGRHLPLESPVLARLVPAARDLDGFSSCPAHHPVSRPVLIPRPALSSSRPSSILPSLFSSCELRAAAWKMRDPLIAFPNFDRGYVYSVRLSTLKFT